MASYAFVVSDQFLCPRCSAPVAELIHFSWGLHMPLAEYHIGDEVEWLRDPEGAILQPYVARWDGKYNVGDPDLSPVLILDTNECALADPGEPWRACAACGGPIEAIGVLIESNRIAAARVFAPGQLASARNEQGMLPDVIEIHGERLVGRHDLSDHPLDCSALEKPRTQRLLWRDQHIGNVTAVSVDQDQRFLGSFELVTDDQAVIHLLRTLAVETRPRNAADAAGEMAEQWTLVDEDGAVEEIGPPEWRPDRNVIWWRRKVR